MRKFCFSQRKIFQLSANGGAEKQNINLVPISQRRRYEYYINHSERPGLRAHIFWCNNYQGKLEFIQTKPGPRSHLSLPNPLPHFQHLLLDLLPGGHPQLPAGPHGGGGVKLHLTAQVGGEHESCLCSYRYYLCFKISHLIIIIMIMILHNMSSFRTIYNIYNVYCISV